MRTIKKIFFGTVILISVLAAILYTFLFTDNPYPGIQTDGLVKTGSESLAPGHSYNPSTDPSTRNITTRGAWFTDQVGRTMILHGINVGGTTKVPSIPPLPSHVKENFYETAYTVSSVGRPFPLTEADEHFSRLQQWGYRFVRLLITWEAIEHAGPGIYDVEYLDYVQALVRKAGAHGLNVFIDPHQDVWSRFTGGDGAPYWTLEKVGFDPPHFTEAGAATIHNIEGDPFPRMIWPTNYDKLGAATMFTLFFGGNDFAPLAKIDSIGAQEYLQDHYIQAIRQVALKLKGLPNVIGFDTLNEPHAGYIGISDLNGLGILKNGFMPTPFEGMVLGAGHAWEVTPYEFLLTGPQAKEKVVMNQNKLSAWKAPDLDIWKQAGVWRYDSQQKPVLAKPDYFSVVNGHPVDFSKDYFKPFTLKFKKAIHEIDSSWLIFTEAALFQQLPEYEGPETDKLVNAGHWYDVAVTLTKEYRSWLGVDVAKAKPVFGKTAVRKIHHDAIAGSKAETRRALGMKPTLVGEFGIPFDMGEKEAYQSGNFSDQEACLDRSFRAMESNLVSYTLWNYAADNDNAHGDQWNGEDFSVFSKSQQKDPTNLNSGGRALASVIRAYPYKVAGEPLVYFFDREDREFYLRFTADPSITAPTEIFLPEFHFSKGFDVLHSKGKLTFDQGNDLLLFYAEGKGETTIVIKGR